MPLRALFIPVVAGWLLVSGCSHWPGPEHRQVTLEGIRQLMDEQAARPVVPAAAPECRQLTQVEDTLRAQNEQIETLSRQLQNLTAATPAFANAACPEPRESSRYDGKMVVGSVEWIYLTPPGHHYQARVDSGATTSSLSAFNIVRFERNGKKWVKFELQEDDSAEVAEVEAPLVRNVLIRQASSDEVERRPVVSLTVNLGSLQQDAEFTLTDRSQMTYPMLLGREFLQDVALIDVGRKLIQPKFEAPQPAQTDSAKPEAKNSAKAAASGQNPKPVASQPTARPAPAPAASSASTQNKSATPAAEVTPAAPVARPDNAADSPVSPAADTVAPSSHESDSR